MNLKKPKYFNMNFIANTTKPKIKNKTEKQWFLLDASEINLGRLATLTSLLLRDKLSPTYNCTVDNGNYVIILNASKIRVTGSKKKNKFYWKHSGYPGGIKKQSLNELLEKYPERIIEKAVKGMLPKNSLGRNYFKRLKVYKGNQHSFNDKNMEILQI